MSRYCPICGMPVSANAKYCRNCGQKLRIISKKTDNSAEEKTKDIVSEQTGNNNISARTNQVSEEDSVVNNTESDTVYVKTDTIQTGYVKEKKADDFFHNAYSCCNVYAAAVCNNSNHNKGNLNKAVLAGNRHSDF